MSHSEPIRELACVVLLRDMTGWGGDTGKRVFSCGDVGTVVHEFDDGVAFEVEFVGVDGRTLGFVTAARDAVRAATAADLTRRTADAA